MFTSSVIHQRRRTALSKRHLLCSAVRHLGKQHTHFAVYHFFMDSVVGRVHFRRTAPMLTQKIPIFPELTTFLTGHGNIKSYLYRLGLTDNRMCPCEEEDQTVDHSIFKCKKLRNQREEMIRQIKNTGGNWPATSETLINNYQIFL